MSVTDTADPKVEDLEREVDASRAQVSHTLDELQSQVSETLDQWRSRLTAEEITKELKRYASGYVSNLGNRIGTGVRENPASALAVGAAAAWPIYKMARNIPLPVYLMGAGVALMKPLGRAWEHGREAFTDLTPPRRSSTTSDRYERVAHAPGGEVGFAATGRTGGSSDGSAGISDRAVGIASDMRDAAGQAYHAAAEMASDLPRRAAQMSREVGTNPLLLGALGLAASAAVAAALPSGQRSSSRRPQSRGSHDRARAAVLRAYGAKRREALESGASLEEAERIARRFVQQMGSRGNQAAYGNRYRTPVRRQDEEWIE